MQHNKWEKQTGTQYKKKYNKKQTTRREDDPRYKFINNNININ